MQLSGSPEHMIIYLHTPDTLHINTKYKFQVMLPKTHPLLMQ